MYIYTLIIHALYTNDTLIKLENDLKTEFLYLHEQKCLPQKSLEGYAQFIVLRLTHFFEFCIGFV